MDRKEIVFIFFLIIAFAIVFTIQISMATTTGNAILNFGFHFTQLGYGDSGDDTGGDPIDDYVDQNPDESEEPDYSDCYIEYGPYGDEELICGSDEEVVTPVQNKTKTLIKCVDSDSGLNYFTKGSIILKYNTGENITTLQDSCQDSSTLLEGICLGNKSTSYPTNCENGCQNGVCLSQQRSVSSSSQGQTTSPTKSSNEIYLAGSSADGTKGSSLGSGLSTNAECKEFKLGTPNSVMANSESSEFPSKNSIDGDISTYWFGDVNGTYPRIIEFDLGNLKCVDYLNLYFGKEDIPITLDIEISTDKKIWDTAISDFNVTWPRIIHKDLPEISVARYIKIIQKSGNRDFGNLAEIEVKMADFS